MKTFRVQIREILAREVRVQAESEEEAMDKVLDDYHDGKIVLDSEDVAYYANEGSTPEIIGNQFADGIQILD